MEEIQERQALIFKLKKKYCSSANGTIEEILDYAKKAKAELEALTEKLDQEAVEKLNAILAMIDENHTAKLQELYDYMANNMVTTDTMNAELAKQDEDFANKFETAIDAVCE